MRPTIGLENGLQEINESDEDDILDRESMTRDHNIIITSPSN